MKARLTSRAKRRAQGMTLFEVILALAIFATVAVALVQAINAIGNATLEARDLRTVEQTLEGIIDEASKRPQIAELDKEIKPGADGIGYHVRIVPEDKLRNQNNVQLNGIFRITVTAKWKMDGKPMQLHAETMRYAGMFMPVQ
jgi:prepilin-type N-terminal cleavage/methylation domain-containing protein